MISQKSTLPVRASGQFSLAQIVGIWAAASLPNVLLAWLVVPRIVYQVRLPAVLTYWLILMLGFAWQVALVLWLTRRSEGRLSWDALRRFAHLDPPCDPKTGQARAGGTWKALRAWPLFLLIIGLGALAKLIMMMVRRLTGMLSSALFLWPAYQDILELHSSEFAGWWWLTLLALAGWALAALLAEELLFRGVLLPRMSGVFRRGDGAMNALLFALAGLYQWWLIPFRFLEGLILAGSAKRFHSTWMPAAIRAVEGLALLGLILLGITSQPLNTRAVPAAQAYIERKPPVTFYNRGALSGIPSYNPNSSAPIQVDLRGADLSALDLRDRQNDLLFADFDTNTIWPPVDHMPAGFDPNQVRENAKNPGLGIRALHAQGVTGKGVGIAILDQALLVDHPEYASQLAWYEEVPHLYKSGAQMHGTALSSIAVGQTCGAAPEARLYYISGAGDQISALFSVGHEYAQAIRRIVQLNQGGGRQDVGRQDVGRQDVGRQDGGRNIRVISISNGITESAPGYQDMQLAIQEAEAAGMMVVTVDYASGLSNLYLMSGLGRDPNGNLDDFASYGPGTWWAPMFYSNNWPYQVLFPMDTRTYAGPAGPQDYETERTGGNSWVPPHIAGLYALAVQVKPDITPAQFWETALKTGRTIPIQREGKSYWLSAIVDPAALIAALQGK